MTPIRDRIIELHLAHDMSLAEASTVAAHERDIAEVLIELAASGHKQALQHLRKLALDAATEETSPEQLALFKLGRSLPRIVRVIDDNEVESFRNWQDASKRQHADNVDWMMDVERRKMGILEGQRKHVADMDVPDDDEPIGMFLFTVDCHICGTPWRIGDPFERAHETPVLGDIENQVLHWAHRSCNRSAGTK